jgi:hypothetical protein
MIPRKTALPWIVMLIVIAVLTAAVSWLALSTEFRDAKWTVDDHPPLPYPTLFLRWIHPFIWILPLFATAYGVALLRNSEVSTLRLSWFPCSLLFALFCWFLLIGISFVFVYFQRGRHISPLSQSVLSHCIVEVFHRPCQGFAHFIRLTPGSRPGLISTVPPGLPPE